MVYLQNMAQKYEIQVLNKPKIIILLLPPPLLEQRPPQQGPLPLTQHNVGVTALVLGAGKALRSVRLAGTLCFLAEPAGEKIIIFYACLPVYFLSF